MRLLRGSLLLFALVLSTHAFGLAPTGYSLLPTENIPIGLGDTPGTFTVSEDGAANYQIPLWVSPGRAGVQPALALNYSSAGDNGPVGVGWNLGGTSAIVRCRRTLAQDGANAAISFTPSDAFCLNGTHLVRVTPAGANPPIEFRPEHSPATRVLMFSDAQGPTHFEVYTRDGWISVYGTPTGAPANNARLEGQRVSVTPAGGTSDAVTHTRATVRLGWALSEIRDRAGNNLRWTYKLTQEAGSTGAMHYEQLPTEIVYTGFSGASALAAAAPALRKVTFSYEMRPDRDFRFSSGFGVKSTERLSQIAMFGPSVGDSTYSGSSNITELRRYALKYENYSITRRSLLTSVQECDRAGVCRVPIEFQWELGCGIGTATFPERIGTGCSRASDPNPSPYEDLDLGLSDVMSFSDNSLIWQAFPQIADLWTLQTTDIDGDGRDDLLYRVPVLNGSQTMLIRTDWVYRLSTGRGFGPPVTTTLPESKTGSAIEDLRTVDIDADGLTDVVAAQRADPTLGENGSYEAFTFDGAQYQPANISALETFQGWWNSSTPTLFPAMHITDLDGDGRPEFVRSAVNVTPFGAGPPAGSPFRWAFRSNSSTTGIQLGGYTSLGVTSAFDHASYVVDWNNDGTADFLARDSVGPTAGDGFAPHYSAFSLDAAGAVVKTPIALSGLPLELSVQLTSYGTLSWPSYHYFRPWFADVNGDGLPDAIAIREHAKVEFPSVGNLSTIAGAPYVAINTGNGFKPYRKYFIDAQGEVSPIFDRVASRMIDVGVRPTDYNGDGRTDFFITDLGVGLSIKRQTFVVLQAKYDGSGFDTIPVPIPIGDSTMLAGRGGAQDRGWGQRMTQLLDANGDGLTDVVQVVNGRVHLYLRKGKKPDMLIRIPTRPQTPAIQITYAPIGEQGKLYSSGTCSYPQRCLQRGLWVVSRHSVENGLGGQNSWKYSYAEGRLDLKGRGWLGFGKTVVTDEQIGTVHTTTRDNRTAAKPDPAAAPYLYPFASRLATETREVPITAAANSPLHRRSIVVTNKTKLDGSGKVLFAFPETATSTESEAGTTYLAHKVVIDVDGYGSPTTSTQSAATTLTPTGPIDTQTSVMTYKNDATAWLIGLPETIQTTSSTPAGKSDTRDWSYEYDATTGLTVRVTVAPSRNLDPTTLKSSDVNLVTDYMRDGYGLVETVLQSGSATVHIESVTYDTLDHTFPLKRTNSAGHEETSYYHSGLGVVATVDNHYGVRTAHLYDGFGRLRKVDLPSEADVSISYTSGYGPGNVAGQAMVRDVSQSATPWRDPREVWVSDRLGRPSRLRHTAFSGGLSSSDLEYDAFGRLARRSLPYLSSATAATTGFVTYTYDNLGRPKSVTSPGSPPKRFEYDRLTTRAIDEAGYVRTVERDVLGRVARTIDVKPGGAQMVTQFEYGPFNLVEAVVDPLGHRTSMEHDAIGRQIKQTSPDAGVDEWAYDAFDQTKWSKNGAGEETTFGRDALGRIYSTTNSAGTAIYVWDQAAYGVGKLAQTHSTDGIDTTYTYNAQGRLTLVVTYAQGQSFPLRRDYDVYGRLELLTPPGPSGSAIKYVYADSGFLKEIRGGGVNGPLYWRADARNAANRITGETFGNGLQTVRTYDQRNRVKFVETSTGNATIVGSTAPPPQQRLAYDYEPDRGLLKSRHDLVAKTTEDFEYDSLARLTKWTVFQDCEESVLTYAYDDDGNLLNRTVVKGPGQSVVNSYTGPSGGPHAIKNVTVGPQSTAFTYDAAGRQKTGPDRTVDYTWFNLPSRIVNGTRQGTFKYDAFQNRTVKQFSNGDETVYVSDVYERRKNLVGVRHLINVVGPERVVAHLVVNETNGAVTSRDVQYLHDERLGSTDTVTGAGGAVVERMKFDPFGSRRDPARLSSTTPVAFSLSHLGFTEHEADDEVGLTNMRGRIYDQITGRFLTPDPIVSSPLRGQTYNPYSYVVNNPMSFTDPSGFVIDINQGYTSGGISFDIHDFVMWLIHALTSGDGKSQTSGQADKQGSAPDTPDLRPSAPQPMTEAQWRAREDPLQNLTPEQRETHEWTQFDKRVTKNYIDPIVKVLAVGTRIASVVGGPELFMLVNPGLDDVDDQEGWSTGGPKDLRLVRAAIGVAWGGLGALTAESRASQMALGIEEQLKGQQAVDDAIKLHLKRINFTHKPTFDPNLPPDVFGESLSAKSEWGPYLRIGPSAVETEGELLETLIHEEMHFRTGSKLHDPYFYKAVQRYMRMKGWDLATPR